MANYFFTKLQRQFNGERIVFELEHLLGYIHVQKEIFIRYSQSIQKLIQNESYSPV